MSGSKILQNSAHGPGTTCLAFSRDGLLAYTGGNDTLVRVWNTNEGADQEPGVAVEAGESITAVAIGEDCWLSGSEDSEVRRYPKNATEMEGLVTSGNGAAIRSLAIDPKGKRVAVSSEELDVKLIDLEDPLKITLLSGHTKCVRKVTWHPSGSLLTTSGADGKIIVWDVSEDEPKQEKVIEGVIPAVSDSEATEFAHDCSAIWHTSGQHFYAATRTHEIVTITRSTWAKSSTFSDDSMLGDVTALALSPNGLYLASSSRAGVFIWSTQNRRVLFRRARFNSDSWSPTQNLLAWTDTDGLLTRWPKPIPPTSPDPVKHSAVASVTTVPVERKTTSSLFDDGVGANKDKDKDDTEPEIDLDNDDWILDDIGDGMQDEPDDQRSKKDGLVKEMVSVTKAQPAFQPGSTPWTNKKRYLDYNMIGVIEVTDQDTHHIVNVEFHDKTTRKAMHFTDHFKYDLASLGERGALFACPPENDHLGHVTYKPYGTWASQGEWTYELSKGVRALGVSAGGPRPTKSQRVMSDGELQGYGNVVVATNQHEITFLSGTGIERISIGLDGDFVTMIAGTEFVFVVTRDGATTIDGSQNLLGTIWEFDDFSVLQKQKLPIPKGCTLKWIGVTQEGAPVIYDSSGVLYTMPRFRIPLRASWIRSLDTNTLERREGKDESYWPVGVTADTFMCLIMKGRQEYPGFPRPLIQELPLRYPFRRKDPKEAPLEEHLARESMLLNIKRDTLGDELTTDEISRRELALDKELIQLIQNACKNDKLPRALELTAMLHHTTSFDMATKVAGFYHLVGLQEKMEALKEDRMSEDRLEGALEKRKRWMNDSDPLPPPRLPAERSSTRRHNPFQDFGPPPVISRPGLAPAKTNGSHRSLAVTVDDDEMQQDPSPAGKRKRPDDEPDIRKSMSPEVENAPKRRVSVEAAPTPAAGPKSKVNPFAKKPSAGTTARNPFARNSAQNASLHKSESFFNKVEAAETDTSDKSKVKPKEKKQMTLFGLPPGPASERTEKRGRKKKVAEGEDSQAIQTQQTDAVDTQSTDVTMVDGTPGESLAPSHGKTQEEVPAVLVLSVITGF
ncbi:hypothetical protein NEOLEDRAFT_1057404 [Neolentinus lepideus HHB14362 ss-1]|uniref:Uncharacterized protein n=1 Tax=Neolentinus lepideus HHB14362 ss-1 TaxID=1314782 RepID=A0A165V5K1_9AGAM|nr:hypothetical protein NEOLEDRAFT_1057404 [Neolentinus lepideus HHB14362 ss-1]